MERPTVMARDDQYVLGHSDSELDRLVDQARFFGDLTEQVLRRAGLESGMRVLDVGCGIGDVSFLAAKIVGPGGAVIGVDKASEVIEVARRCAAGAKLANVRFVSQDIADFSFDTPVDAVIGRFILMYFPEPAAILRRLLAYLKPGGIVVFQEMDMTGATSEPYCDILETAGKRIVQTFRRAGIDTRFGLKLGPTLQKAGLTGIKMIEGARVENGSDSYAYTYMEQLTRTLLPLMERTGVATAAEVDVDTLAARIRDEVVANNAVFRLPLLISAWARKGD